MRWSCAAAMQQALPAGCHSALCSDVGHTFEGFAISILMPCADAHQFITHHWLSQALQILMVMPMDCHNLKREIRRLNQRTERLLRKWSRLHLHHQRLGRQTLISYLASMQQVWLL